VVAPFGKRRVGGYIWSITNQNPPFPTKEIAEVKEQGLNSSQITLAHWMTKHYLADPLDCIKCQIGAKGEKALTAPKNSITTLLLIPYASQVKLRAETLKLKLSTRTPRQQGKLLVGSRSAVFAQLPNLKKIVIEEPENWNYKDERAPYYHAKDIAQKRAELEGFKLELHYLTPRAEDFKNEKLNSPKINSTKVIDLNQEKSAMNFTFVSQPLENLIRNRKYTIVYVSLRELREKITEELRKLRVDRNITEIFGPEIFSLTGKSAEYVVWADVDTLLNLPDFRVHEKILWTIGKLSQIARKTIYLQTSLPQHQLFKDLDSGNLTNFYQRELQTRQEFSFPPFSTLIKLTFVSKSNIKTTLEAEKMSEKLAEFSPPFKVSPPYSPHTSTPGKVQLNIAIKAHRNDQLAKLLEVVDPQWKVEVDPETLL